MESSNLSPPSLQAGTVAEPGFAQARSGQGFDHRCPICAGATRLERHIADDRYGFPGQYALWRCKGCDHLSLEVAMDAEQIGRMYTDYYPRSALDVEAWTPHAEASAWLTWWKGLRSSAFRWVPPGVRVLDVGCGFGESLGYHRARGCEAHGVEADANILRVATRHGLNVRVGLFDAANYAPGVSTWSPLTRSSNTSPTR